MNRVTLASALALTITTAATAQNFEIRVGGLAMNTRRHIEIGSGNIAQNSGTVTGAEFMLRGLGAGLSAHYAQGTFRPAASVTGYSDFRAADVRLLLGPRPFTVELGYARRALSSKLLDDPGEYLATVGVRSQIDLGPAGFSIMVAGTVLGRIAADTASTGSLATPSKKVGIGGLAAETGVLYQAPRHLPLFGFLGYRYERFKTRVTAASNPGRREEMGGVVLEFGLRYIK